MRSDTHSLAGLTVLVTRPGKAGASLCNAINGRHGQAIPLPTLAIENIEPAPAFPNGAAAITIFVSRPAVEFGLELLARQGVSLPAAVFAVGQATAGELAARGITAATPPAGASNSEGLLAMPQLQADEVRGKTIHIIRGEGGREHLGQTLRQRGAEVHYLEVYRRRALATDITAALAAAGGRQPAVIVITSGEILDALAAAVRAQQQEWLFALPLLTLSQRIAGHARTAGFTGQVRLSRDTDEAAILDALAEFATAADPASD